MKLLRIRLRVLLLVEPNAILGELWRAPTWRSPKSNARQAKGSAWIRCDLP
jgi:hypothetical protein